MRKRSLVTLRYFQRPYTLAGKTYNAAIHNIDPTELNYDTVDWKKKYIAISQVARIAVGTYLQFAGDSYRVIITKPQGNDDDWHLMTCEQYHQPANNPGARS